MIPFHSVRGVKMRQIGDFNEITSQRGGTHTVTKKNTGQRANRETNTHTFTHTDNTVFMKAPRLGWLSSPPAVSWMKNNVEVKKGKHTQKIKREKVFFH